MTDLARLERLGFDVHSATPEQLAAIGSLTDDELAVLIKIKERFEDAGGDVEGHSVEAGGVVW